MTLAENKVVDLPNFIDLFDGLMNGQIQQEGYVITSFFAQDSRYVRFEVVQFDTVKNIFQEDDGVIFQTDGKKLYMVYEPYNFIYRHIEPTFRSNDKRIPYRFSEVYVTKTDKQDKIMIGQTPTMARNSFTVAKPSSGNFAFYFFSHEGTLENILNFFTTVLRKDLHIHGAVAKQTIVYIREVLTQFKDFS